MRKGARGGGFNRHKVNQACLYRIFSMGEKDIKRGGGIEGQTELFSHLNQYKKGHIDYFSNLKTIILMEKLIEFYIHLLQQFFYLINYINYI